MTRWMLAAVAAGVTVFAAGAVSGEEDGPARVADLEWLVGRWVGTGLGGETEEVILPAMGGAMPGTFRLTAGGVARFYEFMLFEETEAGVRLLVHHFSPGMRRWEDAPVVFDLTFLDEDEAVFAERDDEEEKSRLRYVREGDELVIELIELREGEDRVTARFAFTLSER